MRKFLLLILPILAACSGAPAAAPKADRIVCTAAYRSSVQQPIEREETLSFSDQDKEAQIAFTDLVFHAAYRAGEADHERNLRVWVTDVAASQVYLTQLYQLPVASGPVNQFVGGHGFTGLVYSYAPDSPAELQFWCAVGDESP